MNLLTVYAVYKKKKKWKSHCQQGTGRGGFRTQLSTVGIGALAGRESHSYLSPKIYSFLAEGLKCQAV